MKQWRRGIVATDERACREGGFSLVEVVIAMAVLMLTVVPASSLLMTSGKVVSANGSRVVAANLAAGCLEEDRAVEDAASPFPVAAASLPSCPTGGSDGTYAITQATGWCQESAGGAWGDYSGYTAGADAPPAYAVLVTVAFNGHQVSAGQVLTTPPTATIPSSSSTCPL